MAYLIGWFILSWIIGLIGASRKIGFWGALFVSLFLSPLIGLVITLISKNLSDEAYKASLLKLQQNQQESLKKISENDKTKIASKADEIEKLKKLKEENLINEDEFQDLKTKVINS